MKAPDFLRKGADLLEERGKQYDQPGGERSMGKAVSAFNTITGRSLTEAEGWLLLQVLKDVRQWQNPDKYHADSAEDCVSYAALKAEALAQLAAALDSGIKAPGDIYADDPHDTFGKPLPLPLEPASVIDDESPRAAILGQNGEMAEEVYSALDGWIEWKGDWPQHGDFLVEVKLRDGTEHKGAEAEPISYWDWGRSGKPHDIIAYRPAKDTK